MISISSKKETQYGLPNICVNSHHPFGYVNLRSKMSKAAIPGHTVHCWQTQKSGSLSPFTNLTKMMFIKSADQNEKRKYLLVVLSLRQNDFQICGTEMHIFLRFSLQISRENLQLRETICMICYERRLLNYKDTFLCFDKTSPGLLLLFYYILNL